MCLILLKCQDDSNIWSRNRYWLQNKEAEIRNILNHLEPCVQCVFDGKSNPNMLHVQLRINRQVVTRNFLYHYIHVHI